jgi:hypothetical protein
MVNITEVKWRKGQGSVTCDLMGVCVCFVPWIACLMVRIMCLDHGDCLRMAFCFLYSICFYGHQLRRCTMSEEIYI